MNALSWRKRRVTKLDAVEAGDEGAWGRTRRARQLRGLRQGDVRLRRDARPRLQTAKATLAKEGQGKPRPPRRPAAAKPAPQPAAAQAEASSEQQRQCPGAIALEDVLALKASGGTVSGPTALRHADRSLRALRQPRGGFATSWRATRDGAAARRAVLLVCRLSQLLFRPWAGRDRTRPDNRKRGRPCRQGRTPRPDPSAAGSIPGFEEHAPGPCARRFVLGVQARCSDTVHGLFWDGPKPVPNVVRDLRGEHLRVPTPVRDQTPTQPKETMRFYDRQHRYYAGDRPARKDHASVASSDQRRHHRLRRQAPKPTRRFPSLPSLPSAPAVLGRRSSACSAGTGCPTCAAKSRSPSWLGHALYVKAIHGAKAQERPPRRQPRSPDCCAGGNFPLAYAYPRRHCARPATCSADAPTSSAQRGPAYLPICRSSIASNNLPPPPPKEALRRRQTAPRMDVEHRFADRKRPEGAPRADLAPHRLPRRTDRRAGVCNLTRDGRGR